MRVLRKTLICAIILCSVVLGAGVQKAHAQLNKSYFFNVGREFIIQGQYQNAIEALNLLLRSQPTEYQGYFLRGVAKYNLNDLHGALLDFSAAIDQNPVYTMAFQYRGITLSRLGQYEDALLDFARAIEMRPGFSGAYYSRAITHFLNQQFSEARADYTSFLSLEPTSAEGYTNRGTAALYATDTLGAMKDYNRAISVNPYFRDGYLRRGVLNLSLKKTQEGLSDLDQALTIDSTSSVGYFYRAMGNNQHGDIRASLRDFESAIKYDPANAVAIFNLAILRTQIGDYQNAIEDYTKVAQQNPENVLVYYNRAAVYAKIGELQKALDDLTKAIEIYPDFANAYLNRAAIYAQMRNKKEYYKNSQKAQTIIDKYSKITQTDKDAQMFSDTSTVLNKILSLDTDFKDRNLNRIKNTLQPNKPLPMFKLTVVTNTDSLQKFDHRAFNNQTLDTLLQKIAKQGVRNITVTNLKNQIPGRTLMTLDTLYANSTKSEKILAHAIINTLMRQYTTAQGLYTFLLTDPQNPYTALILLNQATATAEMSEFLASMDGNYQSINVNTNPEERLNTTNALGGVMGAKKTDYSAPIDQLQRASELMPQLPYTHYNLGYLLALQGDIPKALEHYTRAIELYPMFKEAYYNRGLLQLSLGEREKGALDLSRAGEIGIPKAYKIIETINPKQ